MSFINLVGPSLTAQQKTAIEKFVRDSRPVAAAQADSTATTVADLVADFNTLLANLRAANTIEG